MIAIRRRRLLWTAVRTVLLTLLVLTMQWSGLLHRPENLLYDLRAVHCQRFAPRPSNALVHMDIDDNTLQEIDRWPWDRDKMAEILDEVQRAGPKVVALDIVYSEPTPMAYDENGRKIDRDAVLAATVGRMGDVLLPTSLTLGAAPQPGLVDRQLVAVLTENPELTRAQCVEELKKRGVKSATLEDDVKRDFLGELQNGIYERIHREMSAGLHDKAAMKKKVLPHTEVASVPDRLFDEQFKRVDQEQLQLRRFTLPAVPNLPSVLQASFAFVPILQFGENARYGAFVDYVPDDADGKVREVPLVATYRGRIWPHMGLAMACAAMDVDIHSVRLTPNSIIIPRPGKRDIVIPVAVDPETKFGSVGMLMQVPLFGRKDQPITMYDYPAYLKPAQHLSIYEAWQICLESHRLDKNEAYALHLIHPQDQEDPSALPPPGEARRKAIQSSMDSLIETADLAAKDLATQAKPDPDDVTFLNNLNVLIGRLRQVLTQDDLMRRDIDANRQSLRAKLQGRAVFIGANFTATDVVNTALAVNCPGVFVHGAVFNAIMTGKMWRVAPTYVTYLLIIAMGLLTGVLVTVFDPWKGLIATAALGFGYLAFNGFILFDYGNWIVGAAGPALAAGLVWSGFTLTNFIIARNERNFITRRFQKYVDPSLVDYVIETGLDHLDGEAREMTMGFTDLRNFTTLTESLGPRTVGLLAEYMNRMIPAIRANNGYVSRLMGDGIYFFFNAPRLHPDHAVRAISTVLTMHEQVAAMNLTLPQRGLPTLYMRAGVCSGNVMVGDAGSKEFSDYTAVGDSVNTAARLESANKNFDTRTLCTARTVELLNHQFLLRPIANLRVAGKTKGVMVYEPLCRIEAATPEQVKLAELSVQIVGTFECGDFDDCLTAVENLEKSFGHSKFTDIYRKLSLEYQIKMPDDFDGQVILTEK